jgi:hypothetical protein
VRQGEQPPQPVRRRWRQREEGKRKLDARIEEATELRKAVRPKASKGSTRDRIAVRDVTRVLDDNCVEWLACIGDLPAAADMRVFADGIRDAARIYARDAREPANVNELHSEIEMLHKAAKRREYELVANMLAAELSATARDLLNERGARPNLGIQLPSPEALLDDVQRETACSNVTRLCQDGADGSGAPVLYAPERSRHFPKRSAERNFVINLRLAWLEAVGEPPAATVNPSRSDRPFANLARKCLRLVGAPHADAVELINELNRRRRRVEVNSLQRAAEWREYEQVATMLTRLLPNARKLLNRVGVNLGIGLPSPEALRNDAQRDAACAAVVKLCRFADEIGHSTGRPSGGN